MGDIKVAGIAGNGDFTVQGNKTLYEMITEKDYI